MLQTSMIQTLNLSARTHNPYQSILHSVIYYHHVFPLNEQFDPKSLKKCLSDPILPPGVIVIILDKSFQYHPCPVI